LIHLSKSIYLSKHINDYCKSYLLEKRSCQVDANELTGFLSLQNQEVPGQHILCFPTDILDGVILYRNSDPNKKLNFNVSNHLNRDITTSAKGADATATGKIVPDNWWQSLHSNLEQSLNLRTRRYPVQPWAVFTQDGERIVDETTTIQSLEPGLTNQLLYEKMIESGVLLLFEGGQWIWPGISIGFRREITLTETTTISSQQSKIPLQTRNATLVTLALNPLVLSVEGFLTDEECDYIQQMATPSMQYSDVTLMDKDKGRPASDFRTSQSTFLGGSQHPELDPIDHRTSSLVKIPRAHQEYVQVLRYGHTEKYDAHHDYFDPRLYQNDPSTMHLIQHGRKNRLATVFWYLTDVAEGGETIFPRAHRGPHPRSMQDCSAGLKVKPERGKVRSRFSLQDVRIFGLFVSIFVFQIKVLQRRSRNLGSSKAYGMIKALAISSS
jgi:2OG-Fe(II) oxygenase superfamily